jgi:HD-GYP domain-containing protein (c-di-GMP phosphodiesterase class II)
MLKVPIEQAVAGMVLARSVADPEKLEHVLLKAGFQLDETYIKRLRTLHVAHIWIQYPGLDFLDEILDPQLVEQQQTLYKSLKEQFTEAQDQGLDKIDYRLYVTQMTRLFQRLMQNHNPTSLFVTELQGGSQDLFLHSTIVASLAMLVGMRLENYLVRARQTLPAGIAADLTYLGVGCLLHDIGKLQLPEELRNFHLTAQNRGNPLWQQHTEIGIEMRRGGLDALSAQVVLNHHQHFDGSGFPVRKALPGSDELVLPLHGDEIHVFCRIACVVDRYDGFRHLPDGTVAPNVVALKRLKNPGYAKWFDPEIYQAFTTAMPAFTLGEQVLLNNGQTVVVTEINQSEPCRPIVRPIDPAKSTDPGKKDDQTENTPDINLLTRRDLYVAKVGDFDVTPYLH